MDYMVLYHCCEKWLEAYMRKTIAWKVNLLWASLSNQIVGENKNYDSKGGPHDL